MSTVKCHKSHTKLLVISFNGQITDVNRFQTDQDVNTFLWKNHFRVSVNTVRSPGVDSVLVNSEREVAILMTIPFDDTIPMVIMTETD